MRLIGQFTDIKWSRDKVLIPIVFYHRVALGLETNTTVYISPARPKQEENPVDELIITTFDPSWWQNMYRLSLRMEERHGAVAEALGRIKEFGANIGILETVTTEAGKHGSHHLLAFIHMVDEGRNLESGLLELAKEKKPENLSITPLNRLKACPTDPTRPPLRLVMRKRQLEIDASLFMSLIGPRGPQDQPRPTRSLHYSDTEEKFIQCYFPKRDEVLMAVSVPHRETKGALHSFTEPISQRKANILNSYSRLVQANDTAEWKAIIDVTNADCKVRELLDEIRTSPFAHDFSNLTLSYIERNESQNLQIPAFPTAQSCEFTGRTDEVNTMLAGCAPEDPKGFPTSFLVNGFNKVGKTALLYHLLKRLKENAYSGRGWCLLKNFQEETQRSFWQSLYEKARKTAEEAGVKPGKLEQLTGENQFGFGAQQVSAPPHDPYEAFAEFVSRSGKTLVVLLDDAYRLLHPSVEYAKEANAILKQIKYLIEAGPEQGQNARISWVLTDAQSWDLSSRLDSGLLDRFARKYLHPLSEMDAQELTKKLLEVKPYRLWADHLHHVYRRITAACGNQPFFIELARQALITLVNKSPVTVNIIDSSMIEKALIEVATNALDGHFHLTYDCLHHLCDPKSLHELVSTKARSGILRRKLLKPSMRHVDLAAFPGIRCDASRASAPVRCVELMEIWAKAKDPHPGDVTAQLAVTV